MFSRLQAFQRVFNQNRPSTWNNIVSKRSSGHNAMNIEPTSWDWKRYKDTLHFWIVTATVPTAVIATIINVRANPELTEIPEGYEPRHWEYFKHPVARWWAKYCTPPMELEHELMLALAEEKSERKIIHRIQKRVQKCKRFYNDHRSTNFRPWIAEHLRINRDLISYLKGSVMTVEGHFYDAAYSEDTVVPVEGYKPEPVSSTE